MNWCLLCIPGLLFSSVMSYARSAAICSVALRAEAMTPRWVHHEIPWPCLSVFPSSSSWKPWNTLTSPGLVSVWNMFKRPVPEKAQCQRKFYEGALEGETRWNLLNLAWSWAVRRTRAGAQSNGATWIPASLISSTYVGSFVGIRN